MNKYRGNRGLLDRKRFINQSREHTIWLRNLSIENAIRLQEKLISSHLIREWLDSFVEDTPLCVKQGLKKK